jgi:hypothetical protein
VAAPRARAISTNATRSGDSPDWLTATTWTSRRSGVPSYSVTTLGEADAAGACRWVCTR